jgi:hypothetical protein
MFKKDMVCIYTGILGDEHEVIFIRKSQEAATALVEGSSREFWVLLSRLNPTDRTREDLMEDLPKTWTLGERVPEHLIKKKKRR